MIEMHLVVRSVAILSVENTPINLNLIIQAMVMKNIDIAKYRSIIF